MAELTPQVLEFFPNAVQISVPPNAAPLNADLLAAIADIRRTTPNSKPRNWAGNLYTTVENRNELQNEPAFRALTRFITEEATNFANIHKIYIPRNHVIVNNMWVNTFEKNHSMDQHNHPNTLFSGVYFVSIPNNSGVFAFDSPNSESMITPPIKTSNEYNMRQASYHMEEGELIIFNSYLKHRVLLHTIDEERVSISFTCIV